VASTNVNGFYFAGTFTGTQDFGGKVLTSGAVTNGVTNSTLPDCFLACYAPKGQLLWVEQFHGTNAGSQNRVDDLSVDYNGTSVVVAWDDAGIPMLSRYVNFTFDAGQFLQTNIFPDLAPTMSAGTIKLDYYLPTSFLIFQDNHSISGGFFDGGNGITNIVTGLSWTDPLAWNGHSSAPPFPSMNKDLVLAGLAISSNIPPNSEPVFEEVHGSNMVVTTVSLGSAEQWVAGGDYYVYFADVNGNFSKRFFNGTTSWTTNYGSPVLALYEYQKPNRFISLVNGNIARLAPDPIVPPLIERGAATPGGFVLDIQAAPFAFCAVLSSTNLSSWNQISIQNLDVNGRGDSWMLQQTSRRPRFTG